ncbi:MAG: hypothetical protein BGN88_10475 [Clostridiales bacterium 43-6]|nr:MAG: hypothetical protein BGN88_10475 [Clostridiales bacterium 43-6]
MKKAIIITAVILFALMLIPVRTQYKDGGTVKYHAILYKVVKWHVINPDAYSVDAKRDQNGNYIGEEPLYLIRTDVYIFPFNYGEEKYVTEKR